jgi:hypothetical protein
MATKEDLLQTLAPIVDTLSTISLDDPAAVKRALDERFPLNGPVVTKARDLFREGVKAGWLCDRENAGVKFSRVMKAPDATKWSIDAVHMSGPGAGHLHPNGEVDLCFSVDGNPLFDGHAPGWTVYGRNTWHIPSVEGGAMDILYFLPGGAIQFGPKP